jgi:hypothetical protein
MKKHKKQTYTTFFNKNGYTTGNARREYQGVAKFGVDTYQALTCKDIKEAFKFVVELRVKAGMQDDNIKQIEFILKYVEILEKNEKDIKTPEECTLEK